jgi:hypothetical protein
MFPVDGKFWMKILKISHHSLTFHLLEHSGADWGQEASAAIGFIKAIKTLLKKPYMTSKILNLTNNVFKKPRNPLKSLIFSKNFQK